MTATKVLVTGRVVDFIHQRSEQASRGTRTGAVIAIDGMDQPALLSIIDMKDRSETDGIGVISNPAITRENRLQRLIPGAKVSGMLIPSRVVSAHLRISEREPALEIFRQIALSGQAIEGFVQCFDSKNGAITGFWIRLDHQIVGWLPIEAMSDLHNPGIGQCLKLKVARVDQTEVILSRSC